REQPPGGRIEVVQFPADFDGSVQHYVLIHPPQRPPAADSAASSVQPDTALITLHGHGSDRWQFVKSPRDECAAARKLAAEHGLLLVSPDYRAKTSWMGPAAEADLVQIIHQLRREHRISRILLSGGSMGGTGALTFAALHPALIDGVVSLNGTANLVEYPNFSEAIARSYGGTRAEVPEQYRRRSAEFFPWRFRTPLAATTGGQDRSVPPESVHRLIGQVLPRNSNVLLIHRPQGGHSTNAADTRQALEFVLARMQPRPLPPPLPER
ncbi:MAG: alpha/beta fold hydrolase, partial [Planctomycetaceae bacterium]|nr:alpha/beta fold hydrolase [Planctomycetaceae bacterium]